ncbi:MAG: hypothetical protein Kow0099_27290 [Candidatus Abyssubacteria bacterium]
MATTPTKLLALLAILSVTLLAVACAADNTAGLPEPERQPAEIRAHIDKGVVTPGDIITFTLTADYRNDVSLELPEIADILSDFRIVNSGVSGPIPQNDRLVAERWYKLQADMAGSYVIESIEVTYTQPDGSKHSIQTPRLFLEVKSLLAKEGQAADIRDIKPPLSVGPSYRAAAVTLAVIALALAVLLGLRRLLGRFKKQIREHRIAARPAHEEALEALERLLAKRLIERGRAREFCFELSEIFRRYLQARFGIPAVDLTTEEILPIIEKNGIVEDDLKTIVREFLTETDLVKFAKHRASQEQLRRHLEQTRVFIDRTTPVGAQAGTGGDAR